MKMMTRRKGIAWTDAAALGRRGGAAELAPPSTQACGATSTEVGRRVGTPRKSRGSGKGPARLPCVRGFPKGPDVFFCRFGDAIYLLGGLMFNQIEFYFNNKRHYCDSSMDCFRSQQFVCHGSNLKGAIFFTFFYFSCIHI
jgi:hypothetical protein